MRFSPDRCSCEFSDDIAQAAECPKRLLDRFRVPPEQKLGRSILDERRSLGSVIKLLTPNRDYTEEYNDWLGRSRCTSRIWCSRSNVLQTDLEADWRFSRGFNGLPGKVEVQTTKIGGQYLRVGFTDEGLWRTFTLRKDFIPAAKIQREDDIFTSTVVGVDQSIT